MNKISYAKWDSDFLELLLLFLLSSTFMFDLNKFCFLLGTGSLVAAAKFIDLSCLASSSHEQEFPILLIFRILYY